MFIFRGSKTKCSALPGGTIEIDASLCIGHQALKSKKLHMGFEFSYFVSVSILNSLQ